MKFSVPAIARRDKEWQLVQKLQALAWLIKKIQPQENSSVRTLLGSLEDLEDGAARLQLSLETNPKRTPLVAQNQSYFNFWTTAFNDVNAQAARERDHGVLRRQLLRAEILIGETQHEDLVDFLSSQIYTYPNYLPAQLNKINTLESNPPLAASQIMLFNFPLEQTFSLDPVTLESLNLIKLGGNKVSQQIIKETYNPAWWLDIDILQYWQASIMAKKQDVYDPEYWEAIREKQTIAREARLEMARKRSVEAQTPQQVKEGILNKPEAPWVAAGIWLFVILITNTGFFALSKVMPLRHA